MFAMMNFSYARMAVAVTKASDAFAPVALKGPYARMSNVIPATGTVTRPPALWSCHLCSSYVHSYWAWKAFKTLEYDRLNTLQEMSICHITPLLERTKKIKSVGGSNDGNNFCSALSPCDVGLTMRKPMAFIQCGDYYCCSPQVEEVNYPSKICSVAHITLKWHR